MIRLITFMFLACPLLIFGQSFYQPTVSLAEVPYFECILPNGNSTSYLPLLRYDVSANISGNIADIKLTQSFHNAFNTPIEVNYVFPASSKSAVNGVKMIIGSRTITAEIQGKKQARETYQNALDEGKRASLLEQNRPNVFNMQVGNIMPGDTIKVEVQYSEFINSQAGQYELIIPTTIGDRYQPQIGKSNSPAVDPSYVSSSFSPYKFHVSANIHSPVPIKSASSNTHKIELEVLESNHWSISLNPTEIQSANRDFILNYSLRGASLASGMLLHEGKDENFFMLQIQPPKEVNLASVPPREYLFLVDVSGSMSGFPLQTAKELMTNLLSDLRPVDIFNVITFESSSEQLFQSSQLATPETINAAMRFTRSRASKGGTEMIHALRKLYASIDDRPISRSIILITDGHISAEKELFQEIGFNLGKANVFAFGIGENVNHFLVEGVARAGMGEVYIVTDRALAAEKASSLSNYIRRPALTNIKVNFQGNHVYELSPHSLPDVLSERPLTIFGKYDGAMTDDIIISGFSGNQSYQTKISPTNVSTQNPALVHLWARNQIMDITQYGVENKEDQYIVKDLGLKYHLLTEYTSFVAVDSEAANITGRRSTINQPLARPTNNGINAVVNMFTFSPTAPGGMHSTGAVSRQMSHSNIQLLSPGQIELSGPGFLLFWNDQGTGKKAYTVTVKNIFDEEVQKINTTSNHAYISLKDLFDKMNLFILTVSNDQDKSSDLGIKYLEDMDDSNFPLFDPITRQSESAYEQLLLELTKTNKFSDAFTVVEIALSFYPENQVLQQYKTQIWKNLGI